MASNSTSSSKVSFPDPDPEAEAALLADLWNPLEEGPPPSLLPLPSLQQLPCPFQKNPNQPCFKGRNCPYLHGRYTQQTIKDHRKLHERSKTPCLLSHSLPPKRQLSLGFTSLAWVTAASDPANFHLVFRSETSCLCKGNEEAERDPSLLASPGGFRGLSVLWEGLEAAYSHSALQHHEEQSSYLAGELVAVRISLSQAQGQKGWFRALVLRDTDPEEIEERCPSVLLKLLDYGLVLTVSCGDVRPLLPKFGVDPPMAFNCSLFGISPFLGTWGSKSASFFRTLTAGQVLIAIVKSTFYSEGTASFDLFDKVPIQVSLFVKLDGKFVNVARLMGEKGLGVEWNPFPTRPFLKDLVPSPEGIEFALKDFQTQGEVQELKEDMDKVLDREKRRLKAYSQNSG